MEVIDYQFYSTLNAISSPTVSTTQFVFTPLVTVESFQKTQASPRIIPTHRMELTRCCLRVAARSSEHSDAGRASRHDLRLFVLPLLLWSAEGLYY